ncbi:MAG: tetratricopeptide repeat protein [Puniceicoccales bacterium]|nr:tetratricopeptide repeat protein [Puniceicoccales bacterium]
MFSVMIGAMLPCFARSHASARRERKRRSEVVDQWKISLADLLSQIRDAVARNDSKQALKLYEKICEDYKTSDEAPNAYYARGLLYENNQQFTSAIRMFTKIVKRYPESVWFMPAVERYFEIAKKLQRGVRPRYFGTIPGFRDYDSAVKYYELVVKYAPYSNYAPLALIEVADLHIRGKRYDLAIAALERLIDTYPGSVEAPRAHLKIAEIYGSMVRGDEYNQGGAAAARRYYGEFCLLFPGHESVPFARNEMKSLSESIVRSKVALGDFYFNACYNGRAATILYQSAVAYDPEAAAARVAREKIREILDGAKPKSTPIDFLFPSYKPQSNDEFVYGATVMDRIMDQKEGRVDATDRASVTPFIKSESVGAADEGGVD